MTILAAINDKARHHSWQPTGWMLGGGPRGVCFRAGESEVFGLGLQYAVRGDVLVPNLRIPHFLQGTSGPELRNCFRGPHHPTTIAGLTLRLFGKYAKRTLFSVNIPLVIRQRLEQLELEPVLRSKSLRLQSQP
jgi:hypothetical protein